MAFINIKNINDSLYQRAKIAAAKAGLSIKAWIIEAITEKLKRPRAAKQE